MRYEPYEDEYASIPNLTDAELMEYFLYRIFETEEVWGLKESAYQWITYQTGDQLTQPLWPYKRYADEAAAGEWENFIPAAVSLEFFLEHTLKKLAREDVMIEIMPRKTRPGCMVSPQRLLGILDGMMDSCEYTLDG